MRYNKHYNSFSSGELSPKLISRTDLQQYENGAEEVSNFVVQKSGGAHRRSGTAAHVDALQVYTVPKVMIPFKGAQKDYLIVCNLTGDVLHSTTAATIFSVYDTHLTTGSPVATYPVSSTTIFAELHSLVFTSGFNAGLDPRGFRYIQAGSEIYVTHTSGLLTPFVIKGPKEADAIVSFEIEPYLYGNLTTIVDSKRYITRLPINDPSTISNTISLSISTTGNGSPGGQVIPPITATLTASAGLFQASDEGAVFYINQGAAVEGIAVVTAYVSSTSVTVKILAEFSSTAATNDWVKSYWTASNIMPVSISVYQGRLHFLGTLNDPSHFWASVTEDFNIMMNRRLAQDISSDLSGLEYFGPYVPSQGFKKEILTNDLNQIRWGINDGDLRIGTNTGDFLVRFDQTNSEGYSRDNIQIEKLSSVDAHNLRPHIGDEKVIYAADNGRRIRSLDSKSGDFKYRNLDLSILADHMYYQKSVDLTESEDNDETKFVSLVWNGDASILWALNSNGILTGITINSSANVISWHKHSLGGDATILDIIVLNDSVTFNDTLFLLTERTTGLGVSTHYIEKLGRAFVHDVLKVDGSKESKPAFLDFHKYVPSPTGLPVTAFIGFQHLANQTVSVIVEGNKIVDDVEVNGSGLLSLNEEALSVTAGFNYKSKIKSLVLEAGQQFGNSRGNLSRIDRVTLSLYNSSHALIGNEEGELNDVEIAEDSLFSGDVNIDFATTPDIEPQYSIETEKPLPLNILGAIIRGVSYER